MGAPERSGCNHRDSNDNTVYLNCKLQWSKQSRSKDILYTAGDLFWMFLVTQYLIYFPVNLLYLFNMICQLWHDDWKRILITVKVAFIISKEIPQYPFCWLCKYLLCACVTWLLITVLWTQPTAINNSCPGEPCH